MYKLIASDLDETLLNSEKHVSLKDIESIKALKNTKFVIATGRGYYSVINTLKEIGQYNSDNNYVISYNGGLIRKTNGDILSSTTLSYDDVVFLFNLGLKYDICIQICTINNVIAYRLFDEEVEYVKDSLEYEVLNNTDLSFLKDIPVMKILFNAKNMELLRKIRKEIDLDDKYEISFSAGRYLEFNPKGVTKGYGLIKICELLNIDINETIAIGDNVNDISMLKVVGTSIGVKNTIEDCKKYCDYILENDNNHNPITELVDKFIKKRN